MTAPLMTGKFDLYARPLALGDRATKSLDQPFDICKDDGGQRGLGEDRSERLTVTSIHGKMIADTAIKTGV